MKYPQILFILILVSACSGTKHMIKNTPEETSETKDMIKDSIEKDNTIIDKVTPIIVTEEDHLKEGLDTDTIKIQSFNHDLWDKQLEKNVYKNGHVNYKGFKTNWKNLRSYIELLSQNTPNETQSKREKLAYWINAYNAFTIDLILLNYPVKSIKDIKNPWDQRLWKLGDKWYNLNEIEHQILRKMDEPRIHFTIVCASYSCPKLLNEAFTPEKLEAQLTQATSGFLNDNERNSISKNSIELSKIFQWFSKDFKQNGSLIDFLNQYSDIQISENAKKNFKEYNWDLNE